MFKQFTTRLFNHSDKVLPKKARAFCLTLQDVNENSLRDFWDKGKHFFDKQKQKKIGTYQ